MAGRLIIKLLDALAEIRFGDTNAAILQTQKLINNLVMLMRVLCPMDDNAIRFGAALEHFQVISKVGEGMFLDRRSQVA
jgi:hypothetical protein